MKHYANYDGVLTQNFLYLTNMFYGFAWKALDYQKIQLALFEGVDVVLPGRWVLCLFYTIQSLNVLLCEPCFTYYYALTYNHIP